jgi:CspA family cold shock protein
MTGTVKFYNVEKGFGFIIPEDGGSELFFHITQVDEDYHTPQENDVVDYEVGEGRKGPQAEQVRFVSAGEATDEAM